jgi:RimJ/RimL family protein N-acetyltransferase
MPPPPIAFAESPDLQTARLRLRGWRASDLAPFAAMNADPVVRRWFPGLMTRDESDASVEAIQHSFRKDGFGFWAVEGQGLAFAGFIGLKRPVYSAPFLPAVEVGWRLDPRVWGRGLAVEGARAALAFGFDECRLDQIIAVAPRVNLASLAVMKRLGMRCDPAEDFDHPDLTDHPVIRRCALYRLDRSDFGIEATP